MTLKLRRGLKSLSYPLLLLSILSVKWFNAGYSQFQRWQKGPRAGVCCSLAALSKENPREERAGVGTQSHRSRLSPKIHNKEE